MMKRACNSSKGKQSSKSKNQVNQGSDVLRVDHDAKNRHQVNQENLYKEITGRIIGCAMKVHSALGNGFQEVIYQRALAIEMKYAGLNFEREKEMEVYYRGVLIGSRRADFFVEGKIMVELKALVALEDVHLAQAMNYLEAYKMEIGLLINFGAKSIQFKRVHNNSLIGLNRDLHD
jgi:GxxExxY protein